MPLTEEQLCEIEAELNAATPGPWEWSYHPHRHDDVIALEMVHKPFDVLLCTSDGEDTFGEISQPDADFIAHAPTHIGALLESHRELQAQLAAWKNALNGLTEGDSEYTEPEYCAMHVRARLRHPKQIIELRAQVSALQAENEKLTARLARLRKYEEAQRFGDAMFEKEAKQ